MTRARWYILLSFFLITRYVHSQTCQIQIQNDSICLGNAAIFSSNVSGATPVGYRWQFGDGNISPMANPTHFYSNTGVYTIRLTVFFSANDSCVATPVDVWVLSLPIAKFNVLSEDTLCFFDNRLVIQDSSILTNGSSRFMSRFFLLNNGEVIPIFDSASFQLVSFENTINRNGFLYDVILEVMDEFGCISRYTKLGASYLRPELPTATFDIVTNFTCDSTKVQFVNLLPRPTFAKRFYWLMDDGTSPDSVSWQTISHVYLSNNQTPNTYLPAFVYFDEFGCASQSIVAPISPVFVDTSIQITFLEPSANGFLCSNQARVGVSNRSNLPKEWRVFYNQIQIDSSLKPIGRIEFPIDTLNFSECGRYDIRLKIIGPDCVFEIDTFYEVTGPRMRFDKRQNTISNRFQCASSDTVVFLSDIHTEHCFYNAKQLNFFWDFANLSALPCTTHLAQGLNVNLNCRYSKDSIAVKHFYQSNDTCTLVSVIVSDAFTGCVDTSYVTVDIGLPNASSSNRFGGLKWELDPGIIFPRVCEIDKVKFNYNDWLNTCGFESAWINFDTACNEGWRPMRELMDTNYMHTYASPCNDNGLVVAGVAVRKGSTSDGIFCYDTAYYIIDTFTFKNPSFSINVLTNCVPYGVLIIPEDSTQPRNTFVQFNLVGSPPKIIQLDSSGLFMSQILETNVSGYFERGASIVIGDSKGCLMSTTSEVALGIFASFIPQRTKICINDSIWLSDSIFYSKQLYTGDTTRYWRDTSRTNIGKENIRWDIGDGKGFHYVGPKPKIAYSQPGLYTIKMSYKDSLDCYDTVVVSDLIEVTDVVAQIYTVSDSLYCSPHFINFIDSSFWIDAMGNRATHSDNIINYEWTIDELPSQTSSLQNPVFNFNDIGSYTINLKVRTQSGCVDSTSQTINIFGPTASFALSDSVLCPNTPLYLFNTSQTPSIIFRYIIQTPTDTQIISHTRIQNDSLVFTVPGSYFIRLIATDTAFNATTGAVLQCSNEFPSSQLPAAQVVVLPIVQSTLVADTLICVDQEFEVLIANDTLFRNYKLLNDGVVIDTFEANIQFAYSFNQMGVYRLSAIPVSDYQCFDTPFVYVNVIGVKADFELASQNGNAFMFNNLSSDAQRYQWSVFVNDVKLDLGTNFNIEYRHTIETQPQFAVCLQSFNELNCMDSICKEFYHFADIKIYNVFTPGNNDNVNDAFDIDIHGEKKYHLRIYNRWGGLVFEGFEDGEGNDGKNWNGLINNTGDECAAGVYYYIFTYQFLTDTEDRSINGTITLIRK